MEVFESCGEPPAAFEKNDNIYKFEQILYPKVEIKDEIDDKLKLVKNQMVMHPIYYVLKISFL